MTAQRVAPPPSVSAVTGWDAIHFWVGNARAFAGFLIGTLGFTCESYAGPETGRPTEVSYALRQVDIRIVVTSSLDPDSFITRHVAQHGDGVRDIGIQVHDLAAFVAGLPSHALVKPLHCETVERGESLAATVATYGHTVHTIVERRDDIGVSPGFEASRALPSAAGLPVGLRSIDHVVGNVGAGELRRWVDFYEHVFGLAPSQHFDRDQIATENSALRSVVMRAGDRVVLPLNEPAAGLRKSQIQEFLDAYGGPGVQHIAIRTDDLVSTVEALRTRGLRLMTPPAGYYLEARQRVGAADLPWSEIERLGILVDSDSDGVLLQIFSEPLTDRPTIFLEFIERRGAFGFGEGNFKALFQTIERAQAERGNL